MPLVVNGTFDADASGWALGGGCGDERWVGGVGNPSGSVLLNACGESDSDATGSQAIPGFAPGQAYTVSVDILLHSPGAANGKSFGIFIDNEPANPIFLGEFLDSVWHTVEASFTATQASHTLIFGAELDSRTPGVSARSDVSYYIDNVSLSSSAVTPISGNISGLLSNSSSPYQVTGDLTVPSGQSLSIDPGVVIKMSPNTSFTVDGILVALASQASPIVVTSLADDSVAGDTGVDGTTQGAPGQWNVFQFNNSTSATQLANLTIRFGQQVAMANASPQLNNVTISSMSAAAVVADLSSNPTGSGNRVFGSGFNAIDKAGGTLTSPVFWPDIGIPYGLRSGRIRINAGGRLSLAPGVIVKANTNGSIAAVNGGELVSQGTSTSPVVFTSYRDDSAGGDTNGDGLATAPAVADWGGIQLIRAGLGTRLENMVVRWGGTGPHLRIDLTDEGVTLMENLEVWGSTLTVYRVVSSSGIHGGLTAAHGANVTVTSSVFTNNGYGLYARFASTLTIVDSLSMRNGVGLIGDNGSVLNGLRSRFVKNQNVGVRFDAEGSGVFDACEFQGNGADGINAVPLVRGPLIVRNSTFTANSGAALLAHPALSDLTMSGNHIFGNNWNAISLYTGTITGPVAWKDHGVPYVIMSGRVRMDGTGRLTLAPGVIVKANTNGSIAMVNGGELVSQGTSTSPVVFTSYRDDSAGGDTNNDGNTLPTYGDWGGIQFIRSGPGQVQNLILRWGGIGPRLRSDLTDSGVINMALIEVINSTVTLTNVDLSLGAFPGFEIFEGAHVTVLESTVSYNSMIGGSGGMFVDASSVTLDGVSVIGNMRSGLMVNAGPALTVRRSRIMGNAQAGASITGDGVITFSGVEIRGNGGYGVDAAGVLNGPMTIADSTFTANGSMLRLHPGLQNLTVTGISALGNGFNGVDQNGGTITSSVTWPNLGIPHGLRNGRVRVNAGGRLSLAPGTIVKATQNGSIAAVDGGELVSVGTSTSPVIFTSDRDDSVGGDTNNDGSASVPFRGAWGGVQLIRAGPGSQLAGAIFRYGGHGPRYTFTLQDQGAVSMPTVEIMGSTLSIVSCQVSTSGATGMQVSDGANVSISSSVFTHSTFGLRNYLGGAQTAVHNSSFFQNTSYGVLNDDPNVTVDATFNYWGAATGPQHVGNPAGTGDRVSDFVLYTPFLSSPTGGVIDPSDVLPPRTQLAPGAPRFGQSPVVVSSITPIGFTAVDDRAVVGDGQGLGVAETQFAVDGGAFGLFSSPFFLVQESTHVVSFFSKDVIGHVEASTSAVIVVDLTPPITQITFNPPAIVDASSRTFIFDGTQIGFSAVDSLTHVAFTDFRVDPATSTPFQRFSGAFTLAGGTRVVEARSQDALGNLETSKTFAFTVHVDSTPPVSELVVGSPSLVLVGGTIVVSSSTGLGFTAADPATGGGSSGLKDIQYALDSNPFIVFAASFTIASEGVHALRWFARDLLNNAEVTRSTPVAMDRTPPSVQILFSPDGFIDPGGQVFLSTRTEIALALEDTLSGVATAEFRIDASSATPFALYTSTFSLLVGTHTLEFRALDRVGNLRAIAPFTVSVGTAPPSAPGASDQSVGTLPDGTPIVGSPTPVVPPTPGAGGTLPVVSAITLSPPSPVGRGAVAFTVQFSKPMNNTLQPGVSFRPPGSAVSFPVQPVSFVGSTWTGSAQIVDTMNSGAATLLIEDAQDPAGNVIPDTISSFQILLVLPPAPVNVAASLLTTGLLEITWQAGVGAPAASYNVYRTTFPAASRAGLVPLRSGLSVTTATDLPPADVPQVFYAASGVDSQGAEGPLSSPFPVPMPLLPVITSPADNATVDVSSVVISGLAQPGTLMDFALAGGAVVGTSTTSVSGSFSVHLSLGLGAFTIEARARSAVTGLSSAAATLHLNVINFPQPPGNFQAAAGDTVVDLSWAVSTDPGVVGYRIYRDGSQTPLNALPLPIAQSAFRDLALTNGRTYSYVIKSLDQNSIESLPSPAVPATPAAGAGW